MEFPLAYLTIVRRWAWVVVLGLIICAGLSFLISKFKTPVYEATVLIVVNVDFNAVDNASSSIIAVPTYAKLLTNPVVLNPVVTKHKGMTLKQLDQMLNVKPQTNTQ